MADVFKTVAPLAEAAVAESGPGVDDQPAGGVGSNPPNAGSRWHPGIAPRGTVRIHFRLVVCYIQIPPILLTENILEST